MIQQNDPTFDSIILYYYNIHFVISYTFYSDKCNDGTHIFPYK